jgi:hypothetical protein
MNLDAAREVYQAARIERDAAAGAGDPAFTSEE